MMLITKEKHQQDIKQFAADEPTYKQFADVLNNILNEAVKLYAPLAIVQTRPKSISSFAEKIIRKNKYKNPLTDITDLCGARIITHTESQVGRICQFIKENFLIDEANSLDVSERLRVGEFGYRSVHYIVTPVAEQILGVSIPVELRDKKAEIQVRTLLQHVWADILHDRMYKTALKVPKEWQRESARLAALLENADENVSRLTGLTDSYTANFGSTFNKETLEREISTLQTILEHEPVEKNKPGFALRIARLAKFLRNWDLSIKILNSFVDIKSNVQLEIRAEFGFALCSKYKTDVNDKQYKTGIKILKDLIKDFITPQGNITGSGNAGFEKAKSHLLQYFAKITDGLEKPEFITNIYNSAFQLDSQNPYLFAKVFEYNSQFPNQIVFMRKNIMDAIDVCKEHLRLGIESVNAYFTIGRFLLLLNETEQALNYYLKAISLCTTNQVCSTIEVFQEEIDAVIRITKNNSISETSIWIQKMLLLVCVCKFSDLVSLDKLKQSNTAIFNFEDPVLIIAGGTKSLPANSTGQYEFYLMEALKRFQGTILSGGTTLGVPGLVGSAVDMVRKRGNKNIALVGYVPKQLPKGSKTDKAYKIVKTESKIFSQLEPIQMWCDIIISGINPNQVSLLGIDGGVISAFEYRLALALGAFTAVVEHSNGSVSELLNDYDWCSHPKLIALPNEIETIWAFVNKNTKSILTKTQIEDTAKTIHESYVKKQLAPKQDLPNLKPWNELKDDLKNSNINQATFIHEFLLTAGFGIRKCKTESSDLIEFTAEEIHLLAKLEHGRWNTERLLSGWKFGTKKDVNKKISPYLVKWDELPKEIQQYDINTVLEFPQLLKLAGYEIYRK